MTSSVGTWTAPRRRSRRRRPGPAGSAARRASLDIGAASTWRSIRRLKRRRSVQDGNTLRSSGRARPGAVRTKAGSDSRGRRHPARLRRRQREARPGRRDEHQRAHALGMRGGVVHCDPAAERDADEHDRLGAERRGRRRRAAPDRRRTRPAAAARPARRRASRWRRGSGGRAPPRWASSTPSGPASRARARAAGRRP